MEMKMMACTFCDGPAHPATGCVYGQHTIACHACTVRFWTWMREHVNKRPRRREGRAIPEISFYEAAAKSTSERRANEMKAIREGR